MRSKAFLSNKNGVLCKEFARILSHLYGHNLGKMIFIATAVDFEACGISLTFGTPYVKSVKFTPPGLATVSFDTAQTWIEALSRLHSHTINVQMGDRRLDIVAMMFNLDISEQVAAPLLTRNIRKSPSQKEYGEAYDALCRGEEIQIVDL